MSINVLIADDDKAMRALIAKSLEALGVERIAEAADGDEALALFDQDEFDLILLDWEMPGKNGLAVLQAIRAKPSDLPVIMVTGKRQRECVVEAAEAGVTSYLVKPIDQEAFKEQMAPYCRPSGHRIKTSIYRCRNVMNPDVISVDVFATVGDAISLLLEHEISGLPVVNDENRLMGIVTEHVLIRSIMQPDLKAQPVNDVMTTPVITVDEDTIPLKVVNLMQQERIRRIPVVRDEKLVGIISRRDILRYITENEDVIRDFLEELKRAGGAKN